MTDPRSDSAPPIEDVPGQTFLPGTEPTPPRPRQGGSGGAGAEPPRRAVSLLQRAARLANRQALELGRAWLAQAGHQELEQLARDVARGNPFKARALGALLIWSASGTDVGRINEDGGELSWTWFFAAEADDMRRMAEQLVEADRRQAGSLCCHLDAALTRLDRAAASRIRARRAGG